MKIEKILDNIQHQILVLNNDILKNYNILDQELSVKEQLVQDKIKEYLDLKNLIVQIKEESDAKVSELNKKEAKLSKETEDLLIEKSKFNELLKQNSNIKEEIGSNNIKLSNLESEISNKLSEIEIIKSNIKNEIELIVAKKAEFDSISKQVSEIQLKNGNSLKELEQLKKDKELFEEESKKDKEFIKERLAFIKEKEKELITREDTVNILANRYVKLFGDKGISVKI